MTSKTVYAELRAELDRQHARIVDLEAENAHLKESRENFAVHAEHSLQQLAAEQLRNKRLRDALGPLLAELMDIAVSNGANSVSMPDKYVSAAVLIAEPHDTAALEAYVSEKVSTAKLVSSGAVVGYKAAQIQIADLTRKLDLAREALENCKGFFDPEEGSSRNFRKLTIMDINDALSAIKEK